MDIEMFTQVNLNSTKTYSHLKAMSFYYYLVAIQIIVVRIGY